MNICMMMMIKRFDDNESNVLMMMKFDDEIFFEISKSLSLTNVFDDHFDQLRISVYQIR